MSLALARKYRPATFNDLIGQEAVSQTLSLALDNQRLSHAYLFSGLRGSGKTSTARIFAKALLCERGASSHPCGECIHCQMAAENRHMDIVEMDAASNRGIDDIKDLIEHTKYKPSSARYKIFIIDEVHMLTNQAFNALLKTLEEPPDFVKFILATTDPLKLPATILSRTQHFRFKKIPQQLVEKHLEHILNLEGIGFEREAITIIARTGAGSLRDSLTLLDQAIVYSQNFVDIATVTGMLGIIEPSLLEKLLNNIIQKDTNAILNFIHDAADYEAEMILDELTLYLKNLLLDNSGKLSAMIIERFFRIIAEAKGLLTLGSDGEFVLSLTLFKMMEALQIKDIDAMIRGLEQELKGVEVKEIMVTTPTPDLSVPKKVITITEEEILAPETPSETESAQRSAHPNEVTTALGVFSVKEKKSETASSETDNSTKQNENTVGQSVLTPTPAPIVEEGVAPDKKPEATPQTESSTTTQTDASQSNTVDQGIPSPTPTPAAEEAAIPVKESESAQQTPPLNTELLTLNANKFKELVSKIYDRDYDLGSCFDRNITYVSFSENLLTWESTAEEDDKKMLIKHWGLINMFVKELFGIETKIKNIAKKKIINASASSATVNHTHISDNLVTKPAEVPHDDADSGSMIEDIEMKSSCIAPDAGGTEAAKEKDPSTLLEEPMIKAAMELFSPKKVRIKKNV